MEIEIQNYSGAFHGLVIGFTAMLCSICALGPLNLLVMERGMRREKMCSTTTFLILADGLLIFLAVWFINSGKGLIYDSPLVRYVGVIFLGIMGNQMIRSSIGSFGKDTPISTTTAGFFPLFVATFFNPVVYLDTIGLISSLSAAYKYSAVSLGFGAWMASAVWFTSLMFVSYKISFNKTNHYFWSTFQFLSGALFFYFSWKLFKDI